MSLCLLLTCYAAFRGMSPVSRYIINSHGIALWQSWNRCGFLAKNSACYTCL